VIYSMLKSLGYEPEYVLASDLPCISSVIGEIYWTPKFGFFNSVLVRVKFGKEYIYLNDTNQYAELGSTPHENKLAILAGTGEELRIIPAKKTKGEVFYEITLSDSGQAKITKRTTFYGNEYTANKMKFEEMTPELRNRYYQELVASISQSAKPEGELLTNFSQYPGTEKFTVTVDKYAVRDGKLLYLNLPEALNGIVQTASRKRENPLYAPREIDIDKEFTIFMPPGYNGMSICPSSDIIDFPGQGGSVIDVNSAEKQVNGRSACIISQKIDLKPFIYSKSQYDYLMKINEKISHPRMRSLLVELK